MNKRRIDRVVLAAPGFPISRDDPDKPFLLDHAIALIEAGLSVTVICPSSPNVPTRQTIEHVEVIRARYAPRRLETLASTGSMYREARGFKALLAIPMMCSMVVAMMRELRVGTTIAHGHWWIPGGVVAIIASQLTKRPSVVHLHGSDAFITKSWVMKKMARRFLRMTNKRLAVSEDLAQWGRETCSLDVDVLPMPLALDRLPPPSPAPADGFVLGVGRLVSEKGFDVLVEAVARIEEPYRPEVVVIGIGPEKQSLVERAMKLKVKLHLPGAVTPTDLERWYQRARIVAVPSRREGFGLVAAEALAACRAVVASSVGGIPTIVQPGLSGLLVTPEDVEGLAKALQEVDPKWGINGPELLADLGLEPHGKLLRQVYDDLAI